MPALLRTRLIAPITINFSLLGSDVTGDGSVGNPFATAQHAYNAACSDYDTAGYPVTIFNSGGMVTYPAGISSESAPVGAGSYSDVIIDGGGATFDTPGNTFTFGAGSGGRVGATLRNMSIKSGGVGLQTFGAGTSVVLGAGIIFLACAGSHMVCAHGSEIGATAHYIVGGPAATHAQAITSGRFTSDGAVVEYANGPAFSLANYWCAHGEMNLGGMTFINPQWTTGPRFAVQALGVILTGGGPNYLPGSVAGYQQPGSYYT